MSKSEAAAATSLNTDNIGSSHLRTLNAVRTATRENVVVVDFDETLFLRNSTEEYLDCAYPRPMSALVLFGLKALKPWRLLPAHLRDDKLSKDWCLVVMMTLLFPWTLLVWQYRAKSLAKVLWNQPLIQAMQANPNAEIVVATLGFDVVVKPLLKHLPVVLQSQNGRPSIVSCRFWQGSADRARGKLAMVREALGADKLKNAIAITDSEYDRPLLDAVKTPCLVEWAEAKYSPAMADVYLPLFYSEKVKNPNKSHFLKRVLMGHWAFLAIAFSFLSPHPIINAASLLLLVVSYWCIYEIGYQENDTIGEKYEKKPILSQNYERYKSRINLNTAAPWYWAMAIALPALFLIEVGKTDASLSVATEAVLSEGAALIIFNIAVWLMFLVAVRLTFWIYNQFNEEARIWIYPILQIQKLFGFTLLLGTNAVGAVLLLALVISRWLHYAIYRCGGDRWRFPLNLSCLILFATMYAAIAIGSSSMADVLTVQAIAATVYCALRSVKAIKALKPQIYLVGQEPSAATRQASNKHAPSTQLLDTQLSMTQELMAQESSSTKKETYFSVANKPKREQPNKQTPYNRKKGKRPIYSGSLRSSSSQ